MDGGHCHSPLTRRELEVLARLKEGLTTHDISELLGISQRTVKFHIANIVMKMHVRNRVQAVAVAVTKGLLR